MEEYFCLFITIWKLNLAFLLLLLIPCMLSLFKLQKKKSLRHIGRKFRNSTVDKQAHAVVVFWNKTSLFCIERNIP